MHPFDLYFATLLGWIYHPGNGSRDFERMTPEQAAELALEACRMRQRYIDRLEQ